jgi:hypothetical protein
MIWFPRVHTVLRVSLFLVVPLFIAHIVCVVSVSADLATVMFTCQGHSLCALQVHMSRSYYTCPASHRPMLFNSFSYSWLYILILIVQTLLSEINYIFDSCNMMLCYFFLSPPHRFTQHCLHMEVKTIYDTLTTTPTSLAFCAFAVYIWIT